MLITHLDREITSYINVSNKNQQFTNSCHTLISPLEYYTKKG